MLPKAVDTLIEAAHADEAAHAIFIIITKHIKSEELIVLTLESYSVPYLNNYFPESQPIELDIFEFQYLHHKNSYSSSRYINETCRTKKNSLAFKEQNESSITFAQVSERGKFDFLKLHLSGAALSYLPATIKNENTNALTALSKTIRE